MYIRRIVINDIRGFSGLDFDFRKSDDDLAGWTVITGDNAAGKTALLRAVALTIVGPDAARALQPSFEGWVRNGYTQGTVSVELAAGPDDRFMGGGAPYKDTFWAELQFHAIDHEHVLLEIGKRFRGKQKGPTRGPWSETAQGWFCAGYGPFRRYGHSPEAQRVMSARGKVARFATLFREDATLVECDLWLKELKYRELEGSSSANDTLKTVFAILNNDFFPNGIRVDRVDSGGLWLKQVDGTSLVLRDMSDGFRSAAALVVDILRHLVDVFGPERLINEDCAVTHGGVVLIDEIDAHLHPEWQRVIGEWFKRLFPKIQFIVTTHSPLICQAADYIGIFHLPPPGSGLAPFRLSEDDYKSIIAGKPDSILISPAFGLDDTRSPKAVAARREYSRLRAKALTGKLSPEEENRQLQLKLFVDVE